MHTPRALLAIAHPGHELRIYGWVERNCPSVLVLTDGSGHRLEGRFFRTLSLFKALQVECCNWFSPYADRTIYQYILNGNGAVFLALRDQLVQYLTQATEIDFVVGDEYEGYNCVHDLFALVVHAAVCEVRLRTQRYIQHYVYPTVGNPNQCPEALISRAKLEHLDRDCFQRKLQAALSYPELKSEVEQAIQQQTINAFQTECFYPFSTHRLQLQLLTDQQPYYEVYGEQQVQQGYYQNIIRFQKHVYPIQQQLIQSFIEPTE